MKLETYAYKLEYMKNQQNPFIPFSIIKSSLPNNNFQNEYKQARDLGSHTNPNLNTTP